MKDLSLEAIKIGLMFDKLSKSDKEIFMAMVKETQKQALEIKTFNWNKEYTIH